MGFNSGFKGLILNLYKVQYIAWSIIASHEVFITVLLCDAASLGKDLVFETSGTKYAAA